MKKEREQYFKSLGYRVITEEDFENYSLYFRILEFDVYQKSTWSYPSVSPYHKNLELYIKITKEEEDCEYYNLIFYDKGIFKIDLSSCKATVYGTYVDAVIMDDIQRYYELESLEEVKEIENLL